MQGNFLDLVLTSSNYSTSQYVVAAYLAGLAVSGEYMSTCRQTSSLTQKFILISPTCKSSGFICRDCSQVAQVTLVSHQHDHNIAVSVVSQLLQPSLHVLIGEVLRDVVHQ